MKTPISTPSSSTGPQMRDAARTIARIVWTANFNAANPEATEEERSAAWKDARKDQIKLVARALKKLQRAGSLTLTDAPATEKPEKEAA